NALDIKVSPKPPQPFVGVAPEVTLGAYRIFGCPGAASDDVILAAMELAFNDGMDVINMSLGSGPAYKTNPAAVLAETLIAHGMAVIAAAGNDGTNGVGMVSDIGLGDSSSSVASFDNTYNSYYSFKYGSVNRPYSSAIAYGQAIHLTSRDIVPIFEANGALSDGCDPTRYNGINVANKVVLVLGDFTRCNSIGRGTNALSGGAAGILIQTTPYGISSITGIPNFPMGSIEFQAGEDIITIFKKAPTTHVSFSAAASLFLIEGGGTPSGFSSFGLDGELRSKPDLGAPGGNILSTYPLADGGYTVLSGTSMATPYIAGSHALYMQAKKSKPHGDVIRKVFKNTATATKNFESKTIASVAKQGAGLVNVLNAILTTTSISPDHLDLLDTAHFQKSVKIQIKNTGKHTQTYTLSHTPADALNSYPTNNSFPIGNPIIEADYATVKFSCTKIKIAPGKTAKATLTFTEPKKGLSSQFPIYSGFVVVTSSTKGSIPVHIPYTGMKGDVGNVPIQDKDAGLPELLALSGVDGQLYGVSSGFSFDLSVANPVYTPFIATRLGSHTPDMTIRVFDSTNDKFVGFLYATNRGPAFGWRGRDPNANSQGSFSYEDWIWMGQVVKTEDATAPVELLPSGVYRVVVASQKKLSKGVYPDDFEIYDIGSYPIITSQQL
ncbi:hypothetical protein BGZ99_000826, partial [Dissophora globulifera]